MMFISRSFSGEEKALTVVALTFLPRLISSTNSFKNKIHLDKADIVIIRVDLDCQPCLELLLMLTLLLLNCLSASSPHMIWLIPSASKTTRFWIKMILRWVWVCLAMPLNLTHNSAMLEFMTTDVQWMLPWRKSGGLWYSKILSCLPLDAVPLRLDSGGSWSPPGVGFAFYDRHFYWSFNKKNVKR